MTRTPLILCLVLAGCGGGGLDMNPFAGNKGNKPQGIALETDAGGLAIAGSGGQRIDFGRAPSGVIAVLERELGLGRPLALTNCPTGVRQQIAWGDLVLTFTDERFVGWRGTDGAAGQTCGILA